MHFIAHTIVLKMISRKGSSEFSHLNEFRINGKFCDLNIRVGDRSFRCHRVILSWSMKYFRVMLSGDFAEAESQEIKLNDVNADDFELVLTYVYGGSVSVSESNVLRLLILVNYLGLRSMEVACIENIVENNTMFSSRSVSSIFSFASAMKMTTLVDALMKSMAENFSHFTESKKLYRIPGSDLLKILTHSNFKRDPKSAIFNFLKEWVKFQSDEGRNKLLPEILNVLNLEELKDFSLEMLMNIEHACQSNTEQYEPNESYYEQLCLSREELDDEEDVMRPPLVLFTHDYSIKQSTIDVNMYKFENAKVLQYLGTNLQIQGSTDNFFCKSFLICDVQFTIYSYQTWRSRRGKSRVPVEGQNVDVYAKISSNPVKSVLLNHYSGTEFPQSLIPDEKHENVFTAAVNDSHIYLYNNIELIRYDCEQNRWFDVGGYDGMFAPTMSSLGSCLYMAGGLTFNENYPLSSTKESDSDERMKIPNSAFIHTGKSFKCYDVRENKWLALPDMKYSRVKAASCACNDVIYVSGGDNMTYFKNYNIEYYDVRAGKWSEIATPMPEAKMGHCCVAHNNDHLWFLGGRKPDARNDFTWFSYNLKENTWSEIFSVPTLFGNRTIKQILDVHPCVDN